MKIVNFLKLIKMILLSIATIWILISILKMKRYKTDLRAIFSSQILKKGEPIISFLLAFGVEQLETKNKSPHSKNQF